MRFFMIGSWTEGMVHFQKLAPYIISFEGAFIFATVYRLPIGFPVLVDQPGQKIAGQLIEMRVDSTLLALLDTFHGVHPTDGSKGLNIRAEALVEKISGQEEKTEVYFFNPRKLGSKSVLIEDGDWKKSLFDEPPLPVLLSEKQKSYVLRLGASKGREIVPIQDLSLYRELMKLGLIVDKGRRLALSPIGKDVYSYFS